MYHFSYLKPIKYSVNYVHFLLMSIRGKLFGSRFHSWMVHYCLTFKRSINHCLGHSKLWSIPTVIYLTRLYGFIEQQTKRFTDALIRSFSVPPWYIQYILVGNWEYPLYSNSNSNSNYFPIPCLEMSSFQSLALPVEGQMLPLKSTHADVFWSDSGWSNHAHYYFTRSLRLPALDRVCSELSESAPLPAGLFLMWPKDLVISCYVPRMHCGLYPGP